MRRSLMAGMMTTAVVLGGLLFPGVALANSFSGSTSPGGIYSYNDGADKFCVTAQYYNIYPARITVQLTPVNRVGPRRSVTDYTNDDSGNCVSLATAYEDTYYKAVIKGYDGTLLITTKVKYFYS